MVEFVGPPGSVIWLMSPWETRQMVTDDHKTAPLWFGDASSHIMQVEGEFEGFGENIVGVPGSGSLVKLYGFQNGNWVRGNVNSSGTFKFAVGDPGGFSSYWLAPYDNALCYLTRFAGDADDNNDRSPSTRTDRTGTCSRPARPTAPRAAWPTISAEPASAAPGRAVGVRVRAAVSPPPQSTQIIGGGSPRGTGPRAVAPRSMTRLQPKAVTSSEQRPTNTPRAGGPGSSTST